MNNRACLVSSAYLAPVSHYAAYLSYSEVFVEAHEWYVKQTLRTRCQIASPGGVQTLTVPVVKPSPDARLMKDIRISDHGNWRHLHWHALVTAYASSPFFEYYADDFLPFYTKRWTFLLDFNEAIRETVCNLLGIHPQVSLTDAYGIARPSAPLPVDDLRDKDTMLCFVPRNYWQVFADRYGFQPDLSIADLLFNMGPEAVLVLRKSVGSSGTAD